jgi:hypothetical protein
MALSGDVSMQEKMRLGEVSDIYYYGTKTLEKQAIPTVQDTRFFQALPSLFAGSSTFIISPDQGVSDVILAVRLPETPAAGGGVGAAYNGLAVNRGWGYQLVNKVSVRYGGSSQYFWTGSQIFVQNMRECTSPYTRDALVALGGAEMKIPADFAGDNMYAYIVLNLPHSSPNGGLEKPNPFPSELLNQPIVITVELNPINSIFKVASTAVTGGNATAPIQLRDGWFQVRQIHANDGGMLMRPMGAGAGYSFPLKAFYQNEIQVRLDNSAVEQSVVLTGFRAGDVRSLFFWIEDTSNTLNSYDWVLPRDVQLLYNGTVYQNYKGTSSQIWDLMGSDVPSNFANGRIARNGASNDPALAFTSSQILTNWVNMPFSQIYEQLSASHLMVHGKKIENAVVNLLLTTPQAKSTYVLHVVYSYNSLLFCSAGSSEYIF